MVRIGFTGTQAGMTLNQRDQLIWILTGLHNQERISEAHHGDCVGADRDFHQIVRRIDPHIWTVGYPATGDSKRAHCLFNFEHAPAPPLERNHTIVDRVEMMFATPKTQNEVLRSGTWATIRYCRKKPDRSLIVIAPSGIITESHVNVTKPEFSMNEIKGGLWL